MTASKEKIFAIIILIIIALLSMLLTSCTATVVQPQEPTKTGTYYIRVRALEKNNDTTITEIRSVIVN